MINPSSSEEIVEALQTDFQPVMQCKIVGVVSESRSFFLITENGYWIEVQPNDLPLPPKEK